MTAVRASWLYRFSETTEEALWNGKNFDGLRQHFHNETQICIVLAGKRAFLISQNTINLSAGECLVIPSGIPHRALPQKCHFECKNYYLPPTAPPGQTGEVIVAKFSQPGYEFLTQMRTKSLIQYQLAAIFPKSPTIQNGNELKSVQEMATLSGYSREHYSRSFKARYGISPKSAEMQHRLNLVRDKLRSGDNLVDVTYSSGFADQSHMTRLFKASFGVNPGEYARSSKARD